MEDFLNEEIFEEFHLPIISVYKHPKDYPNKYVARIWECVPEPKPSEYLIVKDTLEEIRGAIPLNMTRLKRNDWDDPIIVENYI